SAPLSKCGRRVDVKRDSIRCWIAWIAGVRMLMSGACACAGAMPSSIHGSKATRRGPSAGSRAMPPAPSPGTSLPEASFAGPSLSGTAGVAPSSPITFSTNSRAASRASAAGKYTLMVTQAVSTSAAAIGKVYERMQSSWDGSIEHRRDFAGTCCGQAFDQGFPVDAPVETNDVQPRQPGPFDDNKPAAARLQAGHRADAVHQPARQADAAVAEVVEQRQELALQAGGE